jgi:hypothetical protein
MKTWPGKFEKLFGLILTVKYYLFTVPLSLLTPEVCGVILFNVIQQGINEAPVL